MELPEIDLVKHYQSRIDPTDLAEICLVSFAIFRGPDDMVTVIPNLVGAVTRGHRDITISVRVTSPTGERLRADVSEVVDARDGTQKIRRKRAWDRDAFFDVLGRSSGPKAIAVARRIEDWAGTERLPVSWGGGASDGYLILPFLAVRSRNDRFLEVDTKGRIWIYPAYIKDVPDYAAEAARRTLLEQINEITGANIAPDKANSYTSLPLSAVADELKLRRFLSIAAEVYAKTRQHLER